jgi:hypothetical protein
MGVATGTVFYRRGVPNKLSNFGLVASGNYPIVKPIWPLIASTYKNVKPSFYLKNNFNRIIRTS